LARIHQGPPCNRHAAGRRGARDSGQAVEELPEIWHGQLAPPAAVPQFGERPIEMRPLLVNDLRPVTDITYNHVVVWY
jgi:hypothetical protein